MTLDAGSSLRRGTPADAAVLARLGAATFKATYAETIPRQAVIAHCDRVHTQSAWADLLGQPAVQAWLAASPAGAPVGYAMLTEAALPGATPADRELRRLYVLASAQGAGIGRALLHATIEAAQDAGAARLLLGVYTRNPRALGFYRRHGFAEIGTRQFAVGDVLCDDLVLSRPLAGATMGG